MESVEEGLFCLERPGVQALQIIFNALRQKPLDDLLPMAHKRDVGLLVRLPLASGLLTGKFTADSKFAAEDHRHFNRDGQQFNVGETFAGLTFERGVALSIFGRRTETDPKLLRRKRSGAYSRILLRADAAEWKEWP